MSTFKQFIFCLFALGLSVTFTACSDEVNEERTGTVRVELTDGPLDDTDVQGVFVTVASVDINGQPLAEFDGKQTIEISAYQQGSTRLLGSDQLTTGSYSDLRLLLDLDTDATGNSPGCYLLTTDGTRHPLNIEGTNAGLVQVGSGNFDISDQQTTDVVIDFDLRKALRYQDNGNQDRYDFVANADMIKALRLVTKTETGMIRGQVDRNAIVNNEASVVAYVYPAGAYQEDTETQAQGSGQILFANATTSAKVNSAGEYTLSFLKAGDYEVIFAAYEDGNNDGKAGFQGTCNVGLIGNLGISPGILTVEADATLNLNVSLLAIRP